VVYGGGGIMPDVFVPLDTMFSSKYYSDLIRKAALSEFALTYADNNRSKLKSAYTTVENFKKNFNVDDKMIKAQIKALIARDIFNFGAYFYIINDSDDTFNKAVESIKDNTFSKMKIANN